MEFYNERVKENEFAFFTYTMLEQNQRVMRPFYPRTLLDFKNNRKNPYDIPKQSGEIRVVACDLAFVSKAGNDNSVYTCARLIPDYTTYSRQESGEVVMENGYRRIISYIESSKGADVLKQSVRIRQLMTDFSADYLVLDLRNAGVAVYDMVARVLYDEERDVEYTPLSCMNDDIIANRIKIEGSNPCVFVINATQKLNSDIALDFRRVLENKQIEFLPSLEQALEDVLPNIREYANAPDADTQFFYEAPFLETQALINETASLQYERKESTGVVKQCDMETLDILHKMEFTNENVINGFKRYKQMQEVRQRRREAKDALEFASLIVSSGLLPCLKKLKTDITDLREFGETREYKPRVLTSMFDDPEEE